MTSFPASSCVLLLLPVPPPPPTSPSFPPRVCFSYFITRPRNRDTSQTSVRTRSVSSNEWIVIFTPPLEGERIAVPWKSGDASNRARLCYCIRSQYFVYAYRYISLVSLVIIYYLLNNTIVVAIKI